MMIGLWGHSSVGKTTWLKSVMDEFAFVNPNIVVVFADNAEEYHCRPDHWLLIKNHNRWRGKCAEKMQWPPELMVADDRIWIVESMRWFNGLQPELVSAFDKFNKSGLSMIIPYAQPEIHQAWIQDRCTKVGKQMSEWWALENCWKEANYRLSSIEKWWQPNGVPCKVFEIDSERKNWDCVTEYVKELLCGGVG